MIIVKSEREIELMRRAGKITAAARALAGEMVKPGVTTHEIDKAVFHFIRSQGAQPSFLNYNGYPASVCVSVNDEIIHGIPGPRVLKEGDIVSVDVGAYIGGFHGDCAATYACGKISEEAQRLIFGHSVAGDLVPLFRGFFDTRMGAKRVAASYAAIAVALALAPGDILFLSDIGAELDAARASGLRTCQLVRPEDGTLPVPDHPRARDFVDVTSLFGLPSAG